MLPIYHYKLNIEHCHHEVIRHSLSNKLSYQFQSRLIAIIWTYYVFIIYLSEISCLNYKRFIYCKPYYEDIHDIVKVGLLYIVILVKILDRMLKPHFI